MTIRTTALAAGVAAMALTTGTTGARAAGDGVVDVVAPWEITSTDPSTSGYVFTRMEVAETLVDVDAEGRPRPGLATGWTVSEDGRVWRFALPEGATFHDGTPLTAAAAAAALRRARDKPGILAKAPIEAVEAVAGEVEIRLSEPFSLLPASLAHSSAQILAPASYAEDGKATAVIGTGPYRVATLEAPQRLVVERFDGWRGPAPAIARARYLAAGRGETRALLAESGDADLVFTLDPASRARLSRNAALDVRSLPIPRTVVLKVNAGHPLLGDVRARRALDRAIDRAGIAAAILRTPDAAAGQLFPPSLGAWHLPGLTMPQRDVAAARALLAELGWAAGPDGVLTRDGARFSLTLRTFPDRPELPLIAAALQDQLRAVGIELHVAVGNSSEIPAGHRDGTLEVALLARNFGLIPDPLGTVLQDFGPEGGDWGAMGWRDDEMVAILDDLMKPLSPEAATALRARAATILHEALPVIPIAWYQHTAAVSGALAGVTIDPFERTYAVSGMRWAE